MTPEDRRAALEDVLRGEPRAVVPARGLSMGPDFQGIDGFLTRGARHARPRAGSIVIFKQADRWVAHRVILVLRREGQPSYLTRGDANGMFDHPRVRDEDLLGVAVGTVVNGREVLFGSGDRLRGGWRWLQGFTLLAWRWLRRSLGFPYRRPV